MIAVLIEAFLKQDCFILAGLIRELDDPHLRARLGSPFVTVEHRGSKPSGRGALLDRADEHGPGLHPQPRENRGIGVERMARQKEADRVELAPQPLIERPWFGLRQCNGVGTFAAKQHALAGKLLCLTAVRRGEDGFGGGMDARAIGFEVVESAGGGETFERALIDLARIEF